MRKKYKQFFAIRLEELQRTGIFSKLFSPNISDFWSLRIGDYGVIYE